jgi:peptide/nickel transport system substrate-binding protein
MRSIGTLLLVCASLGVLAGCAPAQREQSMGQVRAAAEQSPASARHLTMAIRFEPTDMAPKIPQAGSGGSPKPLFNAALVLFDDKAVARPHLTETLPQLNTDSWRVFPDGRMETTYRLRANLTWHDGQPLGAEDFVFAWRVYTHPGIAVFFPAPQDRIHEVEATDAHTLVIRWRSPYPEAGALDEGKLDPLPRHILGQAFAFLEQDAAQRESFLNLPFWRAEYVGAGPYRLERWEPSVSLDGIAFENHALGKPRIERMTIRFIADENTTLTNVLSDAIHLANYYTLRFEHALVLRREWVPSGQGVVLLNPSAMPHALVQFRRELLKAPGLLDLRVRKALAHSIDRKALQDGLFDGEGAIANTHVTPNEPYFSDVDRTIAKYAYDPRRTEQLMTEAGFARDREGFFADASGERFRPDFQTQAGSQFERHQSMMTDTWWRAGMEVQPSILPAARSRDGETRNTFPGLGWSVLGVRGEENFITSQIGTAANRWTGSNRGGWSNADYDRLWKGYQTTLEQPERYRQQVQMAKIISEELPGFVLYYNPVVVAHVSSLRGPTIPASGITNFWNAHEWELR